MSMAGGQLSSDLADAVLRMTELPGGLFKFEICSPWQAINSHQNVHVLIFAT